MFTKDVDLFQLGFHRGFISCIGRMDQGFQYGANWREGNASLYGGLVVELPGQISWNGFGVRNLSKVYFSSSLGCTSHRCRWQGLRLPRLPKTCPCLAMTNILLRFLTFIMYLKYSRNLYTFYFDSWHFLAWSVKQWRLYTGVKRANAPPTEYVPPSVAPKLYSDLLWNLVLFNFLLTYTWCMMKSDSVKISWNKPGDDVIYSLNVPK